MVEETAGVVETAPVAEEVTAPKDIVAAPVAETGVVKAEVIAASANTEHLYSRATTPMTRAPAPGYIPETPRHSDWRHPAFAFGSRGATGGHNATHQATAPTTRPQPVE